MTAASDDHQSQQPAQPDPAQPDPAQPDPAQAHPAQGRPAQPHPVQAHPAQPHPVQAHPAREDPDDCLTEEQVAELGRRDFGPWMLDLDDPAYADDPEYGAPPEWLALPASERARLLAEEQQRFDDQRPKVPEVLDAGFNRHCGGKPGAGFAAGGLLDMMLPGSDLAWHVGLARRDLARLDDDQLIGLMLGGQKLEAWAGEVKLAAIAELDRRRTARDGEEGQKVSEEIGAALTLTPRSADLVAGVAGELARLPEIQALLAAGIIDLPRVKVITRYTAPLSEDEAAAVEDVLARRAGELNTGRLAAACDAAVKAADPQAARKRKEKALQNARVEAWAEPDGTAALAGRDLQPADVIAADRQLDADAAWLRDHGVDGNWNQLRALAYTSRLAGQPLQSLLPGPVAGNSDAASAPGEGKGDASPAAAPVPADAPYAPGDRETSPATSPAAGRTAPAPGKPAPSGGTVNLTMPYDTWAGLTDRPGEVTGFGAVDADTGRDLARRLQASGTATRWCITLTDQHGRAVGHGCARAGPGPPGQGGDPRSWLATVMIHKIETSGCDHRYESAGYRPSRSLRHLIKTRSRRCGYPGCGRPAVCCDDDHTIPYHLGGRTCQCNLYPLCRRHHRCKQSPGWHLDQPRPGELIWILPSGRRYASSPDPYPV
jgi:hypothetical protein